jgi:hypothetical protein
MQRVIPSPKTKGIAYAQRLYSRYVAGELSWTQVREALNATPTTQHSY